MGRAVLHVELPGIHVAAAAELGLAPPGAPVVIHRRERILDLAGLPALRRGQPLRTARRLAPQAVYLPAGVLIGAETYRAVWDELMKVGPSLEPTAQHAGYVDVSGCLPRRGVRLYLEDLAQRLAAITQHRPAWGIGNSKLVARHASPLCRVVGTAETLAFLHQQRLRSEPLLTRPMIELLGELGCHRWGDVALVPEPRLQALFGIRGTILCRWSQGIDPRPVRSRYPPPCETIHTAVEPDDEGRWLALFAPLAETLATRLRRRGAQACEVLLALGGPAGWRSFRRRLARGIDQAERIRTILLSLLPADLDPHRIDEVRVTLRGLCDRQVVQGVLFADEEEQRRHLLDDALSRVRGRYGLTSLGYGHETPSRERLAEQVWRLEAEPANVGW